MKLVMSRKGFSLFILMLGLSHQGKANDGKPVVHLAIATLHMSMTGDTSVPRKIPTESMTTKPADDIIKTVPKVRRQAVPIPVNVQIKPPVIITPKIIKPVIRILH